MKTIFKLTILAAAVLCLISPVKADDYMTACIENFNQYDNLMRKRSTGPLSESDSISMINHLRSAVENFNKIQNDIDNPISAEIAGAIGKHYNDFYVMGVFMFQNKDYKGAYEIWKACVDFPDNPEIGESISNMQIDRGQLAFNRALAAVQGGMKEEALKSFEKSYELGYTDNQLFDSAIMTAEQARDYQTASLWAKRAVQKFPSAATYQDYVIRYASMESPEKGLEACAAAIAIEPQNPRWYTRRIEINEKMKNHDAVLADMKKVLEITPDDPVALYNYGAKKIFVTNNAKNEKTASKEELKSMYADAESALERACQMANGDSRTMPAVIKSLNTLDRIYHERGDKAGKKRVEEYRKNFGITK